MPRLSKARLALAAALLVVTVGTFALLSTPVQAFQGVCYYYSNPQHTNLVGARGTDCCGNPVFWGIVTKHKECYVEYCVWCPPPTE